MLLRPVRFMASCHGTKQHNEVAHCFEFLVRVAVLVATQICIDRDIGNPRFGTPSRKRSRSTRRAMWHLLVMVFFWFLKKAPADVKKKHRKRTTSRNYKNTEHTEYTNKQSGRIISQSSSQSRTFQVTNILLFLPCLLLLRHTLCIHVCISGCFSLMLAVARCCLKY